MRVLITVERYAPAIGGAERVAQRVAEGLAGRGHDIHVMTGGTGAAEDLAGVRVHRLPIAGNETRGIKGDAGAVTELIDRVAPDLVFNYAAQTWSTDCCFPLLERSQRPRMVLAPCGFSGLHARRYAGYFSRMPARLRRYDALVLHSAVYQDWEFAQRAGATRLQVIPNGADPPASGDRLRSRASRPLAVTIGSHVRSKGHAEFARSIRRLGTDRSLTGVIVAPPRAGLGGLLGCGYSCQARARASRGSLRVVDGTGPRVASDAVAAADLFLFTSRVECAPLVILEAMAAGTPWVSYDVGNVSELPGGIVARDRHDLLEAAAAILDGHHPELGDQGRAAWEAEHRWEEIVARYESVFAEVLAAPPVAAG